MKGLKQSAATAARRCVHGLVVRYLSWRLKGAYALKPPLGWSSGYSTPPGFGRRLVYAINHYWWREENLLWEIHGEELRKRWSESLTHNAMLRSAVPSD